MSDPFVNSLALIFSGNLNYIRLNHLICFCATYNDVLACLNIIDQLQAIKYPALVLLSFRATFLTRFILALDVDFAVKLPDKIFRK
jgi:hypothetical protein